MSGRNNHNHNHQQVNVRNLLAATLLNLVITVVQVAGGILSGSLALMSDALHNLSDTFATFIAYMATLIGKRKANPKLTYGYKRIEILAALMNAVILILMSFFLLREAWERIREPREVDSLIMLVVAMIGLLANLYAVVILKKDVHKSINVRAAYVHLLGDAFSSVLVVIGGILIQFRQIYWIDPVITVLISAYIIREAFVILRESVQILMQSTPANLDLKKIRKRVEEIPEVHNMHHVHAWTLSDRQVHLEAHVELLEDMKLSDIKGIHSGIEQILTQEFKVKHITLQFEYHPEHAPHLIHPNGKI